MVGDKDRQVLFDHFIPSCFHGNGLRKPKVNTDYGEAFQQQTAFHLNAKWVYHGGCFHIVVCEQLLQATTSQLARMAKTCGATEREAFSTVIPAFYLLHMKTVRNQLLAQQPNHPSGGEAT